MTTRDRSMIMVISIFAMVGAFWFLVLSPKRQDAATLKDSVAAAQLRLDTANAAAASAGAAKATYVSDYKAVANLGKAVPADDDVPSLVYQLQTVSHQSRIAFNSIKLTGSSSAAAAPPAATTAVQAGALATPPAGATGAAGTTATPPAAVPPATPAVAGAAPTAAVPAAPVVAAAQTAFAGLPPGASVGAAGLPTMPFDFEFSGPFLRLEALLKRIAAFTKVSPDGQIKVNGRLMTIDSISLTGFPKMVATIHATAFLVPDSEGLLNGATPQGPVAAPVAGAATGATVPVTPVAPAAPAAGVGR